MAGALTEHQAAQLLLLQKAGAVSEETAANVYTARGLNSVTIGVKLTPSGLTASRTKKISSGQRCAHYWLTPAGLEQAQLLAAEANR